MTSPPPITIIGRFAIFWPRVAWVDLYAAATLSGPGKCVEIHFGDDDALRLFGEDAAAVRRLLEQAAFAPAPDAASALPASDTRPPSDAQWRTS